jgi:type IV pilus assembly protein PilX
VNNKPFVRLRSQQAKSGKHYISNNPTLQQSGAVLIISLIMLLLLTLIGSSSIQTTTLEEKMAGNIRDQNIAFQAAESAIRDAERDINPTNPPAAVYRDIQGLHATVTPNTFSFVADCGASTVGDTNDDGLCYNGPGGYGTAIWTTANMTAPPSVAYGRFTGAAPIAGLSAQPRYIIEGSKTATSGSGEKFYYLITVRAQGSSPNTVVWLQAVYNK